MIAHLAGKEQISIMMICMGNICRSPAAEVVLKHKLREAGIDNVVVDSSGTGGWHEGEGANPRSVRTWEARGYRGGHTARQLRKEWFAERDLLLVMDDTNYETVLARAPDDGAKDKVHFLRAFDPAADDLIVPDPYYGTDDDFEHMLTLIESACDGLVAELKTLH